MAENGKLAPSELAPIPGGQLEKDAAAAWNAAGGPADAGCLPTGSQSSYRTYESQVYFWELYQSGRGNLAAVPGTSNHGWGRAVDLAATWMRQWIDEHGARYGWAKTEAFSEWWHVTFVGGVDFPPAFKPLRRGSRGPRVKKYTRRLAFIHRPGARAYLTRWYWRYKRPVEEAVKLFQKDHDLKADGVIGPKTASKITAVFRRQWAERG